MIASLWPAIYPAPWLLIVGAFIVRFTAGGACVHEHATYRRGIFGDEINARAGHRSEWVCDECDAVFTRPEPVEPERDPVELVFAEIEGLGLALVAKRLRGLEAYLREHNIIVEWKDETATGPPALVRFYEEKERGERELTHLRERERALGIEVAEERSAKWEAEAERDRLKAELAGTQTERAAVVDQLYCVRAELRGLRKAYAATRANLAAACGECVEVTRMGDEHKQFQCTGRGRSCSTSLRQFQLAVDVPLSDDDVREITCLE